MASGTFNSNQPAQEDVDGVGSPLQTPQQLHGGRANPFGLPSAGGHDSLIGLDGEAGIIRRTEEFAGFAGSINTESNRSVGTISRGGAGVGQGAVLYSFASSTGGDLFDPLNFGDPTFVSSGFIAPRRGSTPSFTSKGLPPIDSSYKVSNQAPAQASPSWLPFRHQDFSTPCSSSEKQRQGNRSQSFDSDVGQRSSEQPVIHNHRNVVQSVSKVVRTSAHSLSVDGDVPFILADYTPSAGRFKTREEHSGVSSVETGCLPVKSNPNTGNYSQAPKASNNPTALSESFSNRLLSNQNTHAHTNRHSNSNIGVFTSATLGPQSDPTIREIPASTARDTPSSKEFEEEFLPNDEDFVRSPPIDAVVESGTKHGAHNLIRGIPPNNLPSDIKADYFVFTHSQQQRQSLSSTMMAPDSCSGKETGGAVKGTGQIRVAGHAEKTNLAANGTVCPSQSDDPFAFSSQRSKVSSQADSLAKKYLHQHRSDQSRRNNNNTSYATDSSPTVMNTAVGAHKDANGQIVTSSQFGKPNRGLRLWQRDSYGEFSPSPMLSSGEDGEGEDVEENGGGRRAGPFTSQERRRRRQFLPLRHCHKPRMTPLIDPVAKRQLVAVIVLCVFFMAGEAVGGALANSLALFTDVLHLGSDLVSFIISLLAMWLASKPATRKMSFGYHRAEVLGALLSVFLIWLVSGILCYIAVERIVHEHYKDVKPNEMLITACLGVVINFIMGFVLHSELCCGHAHSHNKFGHGHSHGHGSGACSASRIPGTSRGGYDHEEHRGLLDVPSSSDETLSSEATNQDPSQQYPERGGRRVGGLDYQVLDEASDEHQLVQVVAHGHEEGEGKESVHQHKNINVRAAFIHVVGDIIQSIGVLVAALIIKFTDDPRCKLADPICTFLFSLLVLITTATVLRDAVLVVMEAVPRGLCLESVRRDLQALEGVVAVHSLHVWALTVDRNALSVHLAIENANLHAQVLSSALALTQDRHHFYSATIQVEIHDEVKARDCKDCCHPG